MEVSENLKTNDKYQMFIENINKCNNQQEFDKVIQEWEVNESNFNEWLNFINENVEKIEENKLAFLLDSLYREDDKIKFKFFCIILELTYLKVNGGITPIENYKISISKYQNLIPTFSKIIEKQESDIIEILLLIMLRNDPMGTLLNSEEKERIIRGLNIEIEDIAKYVKRTSNMSGRIGLSIGIILDYCSNVHNDETFEKMHELEKLIIEDGNRILIDKLNHFKSVNHLISAQEEKQNIAIEKLSKWLDYPTELGKRPCKVEITNHFQYENGLNCTILKYKKEPNDKWLLGIVSDSGTFSEMQEYHQQTELQDAKKLVDKLVKYWKSKS